MVHILVQRFVSATTSTSAGRTIQEKLHRPRHSRRQQADLTVAAGRSTMRNGVMASYRSSGAVRDISNGGGRARTPHAFGRELRRGRTMLVGQGARSMASGHVGGSFPSAFPEGGHCRRGRQRAVSPGAGEGGGTRPKNGVRGPAGTRQRRAGPQSSG
jgi:hypothetical protein